MGFFDFLTEEIAIDLGTANTLIIHNDKVVVDSPSIVALDRTNKKIIAVGQEARLMQGKTHPNITTVRPLKDGVIADFDASEQMIGMLIKSIPALRKRFFSPSLRMVVCIPSGITEVETRAVRESCERVNGKDIYLVHEPMAAAIGIGLDIMQPKGNMIIDIGYYRNRCDCPRRYCLRQISENRGGHLQLRYRSLYAYPAQPLRGGKYCREYQNHRRCCHRRPRCST